MAKRDCSELAKAINDAIMNLASRPEVKTLDDAVTQYQKLVPGITRQMVVDSIVEATEGTTGDADSLAAKINAIKQEARTDKTLQGKIKELEAWIKAGAVPAAKKRKAKAPPEAIKALRDVRDGLKKQLAQSEPVKRARVQAQIDDLTRRIKTGDIYPNIKRAESPKSKELERKEFERDELRRQIRRDLAELKPQTMFQKVGGFFDISRDATLSFDLGNVLRQGGFRLLSSPKSALPALKEMVKATASEKGLAEVDKAIEQHPMRPLFDKAKGFIAPTDGTHRPSKREEAHRSAWAEKHIPGIRMSNRAYVSFLNKLRIDMFSTLVNTMDGDVTLDEAKVLARFVNIATGRGELGKFSQVAEFLAIPFLAPRWVTSRFQLLGGAITTPFKAIAGQNKRVHRLILRQYAKYMVGVTLVMAMLKMIGDIFDEEVKLELNPLSTDFGKARIKNTRIDLLSGLAQPTVLLTRLALGKTKSASTRRITPIRPGRGVKKLKTELEDLRKELKSKITKERRKEVQFRIKEVRDLLQTKEVPFGGATTAKVIGQFSRYKFSPLVKFPFDALSGTNAVGEPVTLGSTALDFITPLSLKDVKESIEELGIPGGTAVSMAAVLGAATNTYGYETDIRTKNTAELQEELDGLVYKRSSRSRNKETGEIEVRVKGQAHKGKEFKVDALKAELDKRGEKKEDSTNRSELDNIMNKVGIPLRLGD